MYVKKARWRARKKKWLHIACYPHKGIEVTREFYTDKDDRLSRRDVEHQAKLAYADAIAEAEVKWQARQSGGKGTLKFVFDGYRNFLKSPQSDVMYFEFWRERLGEDIAVADITTDQVKEAASELQSGTIRRRRSLVEQGSGERPRSLSTVLHYVAFLQRALVFAEDIQEVVFSDMRRVNFRAVKKIVRNANTGTVFRKRPPLSDAEIIAIRGAIDPDYLPVIDWFLNGGQRKSNVVNLKKTEIVNGSVVEVIGKGDTPLSLPLTASLDAILDGARAAYPDGEAVFSFVAKRTQTYRAKDGLRRYKRGERYPITEHTLRGAWRNACVATGIGRTIHDLRRTYASRLKAAALSGRSDDEATKIAADGLGHSKRDAGRTAMRHYISEDQRVLAEHMERMSNDLRKVTAPDLKLVGGTAVSRAIGE